FPLTPSVDRLIGQPAPIPPPPPPPPPPPEKPPPPPEKPLPLERGVAAAAKLVPNDDPNDPSPAKPLNGAPPFGMGWYQRAYDVDSATSGTRNARPRTSSSLTPSATAYTR